MKNNILIYLFVLLLFTCSTCERTDSNPSTVRISLENNSNSEIELRFFKSEERLRAILNPYQQITLYEGTGLDVSGLLREYPVAYDSLQFIEDEVITSVYYNRVGTDDCLVDKNPLCMEQYQKLVRDGKKKTTITDYVIMIK